MLAGRVEELIIFLTVVDGGSFVAGGRANGITRSAASKAVARLEDRLGVRLLNRTTRAQSLTNEGQTFYKLATAVVMALNDAEASVTASVGTPSGVLRLTVPDVFGRRVVLPVLGQFLAKWSGVQAEVSFTDRAANLVEEGFDLAFRIDNSTTDSRLVSRVVARYERILVASQSYLDEFGEPMTVDDLCDHKALLFVSRGHRQSWRLATSGGEWVKPKLSGRIRLDSGEALRDAAVAGLGVALLPIFMVAEELCNGKLRRLLPQVVTSDVEVTAIYPTKRLLEPRVRRFIDFFVTSLTLRGQESQPSITS
jgi:DNA-binding transcriptional LysR family regulator